MKKLLYIFLKFDGVIFWALVASCLFNTITTQEVQQVNISAVDRYRITKCKMAGWIVLTIAAFADGAVEGYEFDGRTSFERKWGADPSGFWGSQSWRMVYKNGNPEDGYKSWWHEKAGAMDFYHVADDVRKTFYICGGLVVGICAAKKNKKFKHYLYDFAISLAITSLAKNAGMIWVRS